MSRQGWNGATGRLPGTAARAVGSILLIAGCMTSGAAFAQDPPGATAPGRAGTIELAPAATVAPGTAAAPVQPIAQPRRRAIARPRRPRRASHRG